MEAWTPGAAVGPYTLVALIGRGGMGEVWKAHDARLGRTVAIKRLLAPGDGFKREARAIAALNHPHICTVHDIGDDYFVMEFIEGEPLSGPVDPGTAIDLAGQIAAALDAAHGKGIVHRDLKPANVLVAHGRVKLVDFGIARLSGNAGTDTTVTGAPIVGTPAYMAPEQIKGDAGDARSDIFSFGAVLYELLSGRRAFPADSAAETLSAVLRDRPSPLQAPGALGHIVSTCLEKNPDARYQTAAALLQALRDAAAQSKDADTPSIAVLPFANMSSDPEQEYFSDGLTEEIINTLARLSGVKVIARTSSFAFKGRHVDVRQIADALGVTRILEGSVRKGGNRIRVTAQLIKVDDGSHVWSERYDRELADIFAVQDEIATAISLELKGKLAPPSRLRRVHTPRLDAYEAYLMARHQQWGPGALGPGALERVRASYERAIALDPAFALPHAGLAELFHILGSCRGGEAQGCRQGVRHSAERALALDPDLAEGHAWLGVLATTYDYDWTEADRRFRLATTQDPRLRHWNGYFHLRFIGRAAEAVSEHEASRRDDPLSLIAQVGHVMSLMSAGRADDAAKESRRLIELEPNFPATYTLLAFDLPRASLAEALTFAERGFALSASSAGSAGLLAGLLRRAGDNERADALMQPFADSSVYGHPIDLALFHLASGDVDGAIPWIDNALQQRHPLAMMTLIGGPYSPLIRASPGWPKLARRINLPE